MIVNINLRAMSMSIHNDIYISGTGLLFQSVCSHRNSIVMTMGDHHTVASQLKFFFPGKVGEKIIIS